MCYICDQENQVEESGTLDFWDPETNAVNVGQLADAVRSAALRNPDKIYERPNGGGCKYTHETEDEKFCPGCIVGQGIFDITGQVVDQSALGMSVNSGVWLRALNAASVEPDKWGDTKVSDDPLTRYLTRWLRTVQSQQDDGKPWGEAVSYADQWTHFADYLS